MLFTWTDGGYYYYLTMVTKDAELQEQRLNIIFLCLTMQKIDIMERKDA
jgi:hypothetical protein